MNTSPSLISKLTTDNGINYMNIALMLISVVMAYIVPFELFLFSYGVLGPLHYLTEISWLEKKNYFIKSKTDIWFLILVVLFITIGLFDRSSKTNNFIASFLFLGFSYGLILVLVENTIGKVVLSLLAFIISVALNFNEFPNLPFTIFAIWLPTIIHVYIFTGLFMLYGALKSKSKTGLVSVAVFVFCAFLFFIYKPLNIGIPVSSYGKEAYSLFTLLNKSLYELFGYGSYIDMQNDPDILYFNENSIIIMRFIAFAYTYHYLNWFSKTTVIKWNDVSKTRMTVIIALWIVSVGLYVFNYRTGFYALFLLSMLHVFLEFPLNHRSIIGIIEEIRMRLQR